MKGQEESAESEKTAQKNDRKLLPMKPDSTPEGLGRRSVGPHALQKSGRVLSGACWCMSHRGAQDRAMARFEWDL